MAEMTPVERATAALKNEEVDRLTVYPIACGVFRKLIGNGKTTYREWCSDPKLWAQAFVKGQEKFGLDFQVGLMDLSVMAGDLGAHVRMDEENTPFIDQHINNGPEDYENFTVPDVKKGRTSVLIEGTKEMAAGLNGKVVNSAFVEGPLLALSQTVGAERLFMDMFTDPAPVHKALKVMQEYDSQIIKAMGQTGINALMWDYLWGNYSVLGDAEYHEFEAQYAQKLNQEVLDNGMALAIHNCADLPHLNTQIKEYKPSIYSMAYYPQVEGSSTASKVIEEGYADNCLVAGQIDPQLFIRGTAEDVTKATKDLCQEVKTALCKRGLKSSYCISTNCEVPPDINCKLENITAMVDAVKQYGKMTY